MQNNNINIAHIFLQQEIMKKQAK